MQDEGAGGVTTSLSTWQQPLPTTTSPARDTVLRLVADRVLALGVGRLRIAVDGRTASGKTTFGDELADVLSKAGRAVLRASLDDFKKPWRDRHQYDRESGEGYYRNAFDDDAARRLLLDPAGPTGDGMVALCSIDPLTQVNHSTDQVRAGAGSVLVVDGVFAFRPAIDDVWDLRIWLEVTEETSISRGAARDVDWAGSAAEAIHRDRYAVAEAHYLREVDPVPMADLVIDNTVFLDPLILRS